VGADDKQRIKKIQQNPLCWRSQQRRIHAVRIFVSAKFPGFDLFLHAFKERTDSFIFGGDVFL
jgi:hypothetical protein